MGTLVGGFLNPCYNEDIKADTLPTLSKAYRRGWPEPVSLKLMNMRLGPRKDPSSPRQPRPDPQEGYGAWGSLRQSKNPALRRVSVSLEHLLSYPLRPLNRKSRSKPRASSPEIKSPSRPASSLKPSRALRPLSSSSSSCSSKSSLT